jgi:formate-dependent nitrite reductase membrane component NrfD
VRKPEKGTVPQLLYIDADEHSLTPSATRQAQEFGMWSQVAKPEITDTSLPLPGFGGMLSGAATFSLHDLIPQQPHTVYDVAHAVPWGRKVSSYIWTKSIAAGAFLLSALGVALGLVPDNPLLTWAAPLLALLFLAITTALLVLDLKRPERFYTILLRPQWGSWLAIGGYILVIYGALVGLSVLAAIFGATPFRHFLLWPGGVFAVLAAIYTGFLFGQAKGRDLWLSPALPVHLLVQALLAGAAALAIIAVGVRSNAETAQLLHDVLLWSLLANLFIMLVGELWMHHGTRDAAQAARIMLRGAYCKLFWGMVVGLGHAVPVLLLVLVPGAPLVASFLASCGALVGLLVFEHLWLMAGQAVPLS